MPRISIDISPSTAERLTKLAIAEKRDARQQAAWLLEHSILDRQPQQITEAHDLR